MAPGFYDAAPIEDPGLARCVWTKRFASPVVYQESDFIRAYFEPADLAAHRQALPAPFSMPPRPLVRVSVLDVYEMVNGPIYDACAGGRNALGTPKVMRRITLEREAVSPRTREPAPPPGDGAAAGRVLGPNALSVLDYAAVGANG